MRTTATVFSIVLLATPVFAAPARSIDLANVPQQCRSVSEVPRSARTIEPALSARVSAASCMAEAALADRTLKDDDASIRRADTVTAPLIATLDDVASHGDPSTQVIAEYTKGDLLFGLEARLRETIPPITQQTSTGAAQTIEQRHRALEPKLVRWDREAIEAFRRIERIAQANPKVTDGNPVAQYMVREAARVTALQTTKSR